MVLDIKTLTFDPIPDDLLQPFNLAAAIIDRPSHLQSSRSMSKDERHH